MHPNFVLSSERHCRVDMYSEMHAHCTGKKCSYFSGGMLLALFIHCQVRPLFSFVESQAVRSSLLLTLIIYWAAEVVDSLDTFHLGFQLLCRRLNIWLFHWQFLTLFYPIYSSVVLYEIFMPFLTIWISIHMKKYLPLLMNLYW